MAQPQNLTFTVVTTTGSLRSVEILEFCFARTENSSLIDLPQQKDAELFLLMQCTLLPHILAYAATLLIYVLQLFCLFGDSLGFNSVSNQLMDTAADQHAKTGALMGLS